MERVRVVRAGLVIGWVLVAALVVAGFAAFSADRAQTSRDPADIATAQIGDLGRNTGAVAGLGFAAAPAPNATSTSLQLDPRAEETILAAAGITTTTSTPSTDTSRPRGLYVRSKYLEETDVRALVSTYFHPEDVNHAMRIAWCESSFNPDTVNPATGASGLFQILPSDWAQLSQDAGLPGASIFDPESNVAVAAWLLYQVPGAWGHWDCTQ